MPSTLRRDRSLIAGGVADAVCAPDLVDREAGIGLLQNRYDLSLGEHRLAHGNLLAQWLILPEGFPFRPSTFQGSLGQHQRGKERGKQCA